jgi:hypothetical protein
MIEFNRETYIERYNLQFNHILKPAADNLEHQIPDRRKLETQYISVDTPPEYLPLHLDIETHHSTAISPFQIQNIERDDLGTEIPIKIQASPDDHISFRIIVSRGPLDEAQRIQSLQVAAPSLNSFELAYEILSRKYDKTTFEKLTSSTENDFKPRIALEFIDKMREYLSAHQYLRLLNVLIESYVDEREFFEELDLSFFADSLPGMQTNNAFQITSAARLQQYCDTAAQLPFVPDFSAHELIEPILRDIDEQIVSDVETPLERLLNLDQILDVSREYPQCLHNRHYLGLVTELVVQGRYYDLRPVIKQWIKFTNLDPISNIEIEKNHHQEFLDDIAAAVYNILRNGDVKFNYLIPGYRAVAELYERVEKVNHARTAWFFHHRLRGLHYRNQDNYDAACTEFKQARAYSLREIEEHGEDRFTNYARVWVDLHPF